MKNTISEKTKNAALRYLRTWAIENATSEGIFSTGIFDDFIDTDYSVILDLLDFPLFPEVSYSTETGEAYYKDPNGPKTTVWMMFTDFMSWYADDLKKEVSFSALPPTNTIWALKPSTNEDEKRLNLLINKLLDDLLNQKEHLIKDGQLYD